MSEELVNGSEVQISCPAARGRSSKHNLSDMLFANEASHHLGHAATLQLGYLHASFTQGAERFANTRRLAKEILGTAAVVVEQIEIVDGPLSSEESNRSSTGPRAKVGR